MEMRRSLRVVLNKCQEFEWLNRFNTKASICTLFRLGNKEFMQSMSKLITNSLLVLN
jgi:hypothetical protein